MRTVLFVTAILLMGFAAAQTSAAPGDSWILSVASTQDGSFTAYAGADGNGGTAYQGDFNGGIARIYWDTASTTMDTATRKYWVSYYMPTVGANAWQPIESMFHGTWEDFPMEADIPWAGSFGTNHQYGGAYNKTPGTWNLISGSHVEVAGQMYLQKGSRLYVKWDYAFAINNTVGAIRLTEVPEPSGIFTLLAGIPALLMFRRKR